MTPTSWLEINLLHLDGNLAHFRKLAPTALLCGTVKADAYGLGVAPIAKRLALRGIDMLAVYSPQQAEQLVSFALPCPILVLMRMSELSRSDPLYRPAVTGRLQLSIHDREQMQELELAARMLGAKLQVHLFIDTGMSRSGLNSSQLSELLGDLGTMRHIQVVGAFTHLASADSDEAFTDAQVKKLDGLLALHRGRLPKDLIVHVANTHATLRATKYHRDMVRIGLGLYGYGGEPGASSSNSVRPILRWLSRVIHVQEYPKDTPVGYGSTFRTTRDSLLGLVPAGYADGYPRSLSNRSVVALPECEGDGKMLHAPVVGRVNMDQIVIDLTDTPASCGTLVELISDDPASPCALPRLAALAGTNEYEMLCRLSPRLPRKYVS